MDLHVESREDVSSDYSLTKCSPVAAGNGFLVAARPVCLALWEDDFKVEVTTEHRSPITSLCVSAAADPYICSCSDDKVILWSQSDFHTKLYRENSAGLLVGVDLGAINDCSISCDNAWLALCRENYVWLVRLEMRLFQHGKEGSLRSVSHHATLEAAGSSPSYCCFSPTTPELLVTVDDSNTFKVWSAETGRVAQRSAVGGWHRVSLCDFVLAGALRGHLLLGTNRGALHLFAVGLDQAPRDLGHVPAVPPTGPGHGPVTLITNHGPPTYDGSKNKSGADGVRGLHNHQESTPSSASGPGLGGGASDGCEAGCVVLSALLLDGVPKEDVDAAEGAVDDSVVDDILGPAPLLVVCSNLGIAVYDANSWDCCAFQPYADLLSRGVDVEHADDGDPWPSLVSGAVLSGRSPTAIRCLVTGLGFGTTSFIVRMACRPRERRPPGLSFLALSTVSERSPLRAQFSRPAADSVQRAYGTSTRTRGSARAPASRPVRSSGYGAAAPRRQLFVPDTAVRHQRRVTARAPAAPGQKGLLAQLDDGDLLRTWRPPLRQRCRVSLWEDFGTAVRLASSGDGQSLACSSGPGHGPGVLSVLRWARPARPSVDDCVRIAGHDARITSVCFSANSSWLMSASSDGRTKVWDWRERRCVLDIDGDPPRGGVGGGPPRNHHAVTAVTQAAFFYLDKFILQARGDAVEMLCHRLHEHQDAVAKPGLGPRGWRRVRRIKFPTQQVTCFLAPNTFYSNLMVVGCASRSLHVYDVDAERFLVEIRDAHPRASHSLATTTPSLSGTPNAAAADLLVSAAICDGTKLWDLRQARCVQKFMRHLNRAHACGVALSPCCRYLSVGSEDKCVYIYDTRKSKDYVDKLFGLNEVVLDVAWSCSQPQLAASALNSCVAIYSCN